MSFLNAAFAIGSFAFVIPLTIHLLFRSRFRSVDWGAMFLIQDIVQTNRRRMRWHHWILLALRCAIPILLALAMARPLISSMHAMAGGQPVSLIIVVDDSRSMSAGQRASNTIQSTHELLQSLSRRDEVIVIPTSQLASAPEKGSIQNARTKLRKLRFDSMSVKLDEMIEAAISACDIATYPFRRIIICTDFQDEIVSSVTSDAKRAIADRMKALEPSVELDLLNVSAGEKSSEMGNVFIEKIEYDSPAILTARPVNFTATIRNQSDASLSGMRCDWSVNGSDKETSNVSIPPRSNTQVHWKHTFARDGGASVGLSLQHQDTLLADNRRRLAINVLRQIRVWLVDGDPSNEPLRSETDFLKVALSPFALQSGFPVLGLVENPSALGSLTRSNAPAPIPDARASTNRFNRDVVSTRVLTASSFLRAFKQLSGRTPKNSPSFDSKADVPDLLVFANMKSPPDQQTTNALGQTLQAFLSSGASILFFDGDQLSASDWANCDWLPATPLETIQRSESPFRLEAPGARFAPWAVLGRPGNSLLGEVQIKTLRQLRLTQDASVLMRTDSGEPIVVQKRFVDDLEAKRNSKATTGQPPTGGRIVQFAIPCDTDWSNLPLRPIFLPLIQQLVLDMAGDSEPLNANPGSTLRINLFDAAIGPDDSIRSKLSWRVTGPNRSPIVQTTEVGESLVFSNTSDVGVYRFTPLDQDNVNTPNEHAVASVRVIEVPSSESWLRTSEDGVIESVSESLGGEMFHDASRLIAAATRDRFGLEIGRPLLWMLLAVMVAEILWQRRDGTRSPLNRDHATSKTTRFPQPSGANR